MSHHQTSFHILQMPWDVNCHAGFIKSFTFVKFLKLVMGFATDAGIDAPGNGRSCTSNMLLLSLPLSRAGVGEGGNGGLASEPLTGVF